MNKVVVATKNKGKLKEIKQILAPMGFNVISREEANIDMDIDETGDSFEENAMLKALAVHKLTGAIVIADDSGLETDALNGAPGIYSARYSGANASDDKNNEKLLIQLKDIPDEKRTARFVCAIAVVFDENRKFTVKGTVDGIINRAPAGENGFGYDPLFYIPQYGKTVAQLSSEEKNKISHRGKALEKMVVKMKEY